VLGVLGLEDDEELAYRALIEVAACDSADLAVRLSRPRIEAERLLASLEQKGLAARSGGGDHLFVASPPGVALRALIVQRQEELRAAGAMIGSLSERYHNSRTERSVGELIDVIHGPAAVAQRFQQLQDGARFEVATFVRAQVAYVSVEANSAEDVAVARGVKYRIVAERDALSRPGYVAAAEEALENGEEIRVVPKVPIRLVIVDREIALVPTESRSAEGPGSGALLVHASGLLEGLLGLFERVWREAVPLGLSSSGRLAQAVNDENTGLNGLDTKIFGLLLAGLTDQVIGSQLGLSLRTVQRRVRALMDLAGVDTRLQLGFQAAQHGWVRVAETAR
jgi:sugar-specific transcriptional regulator TrmB/DNA-binding CsgD family transcriptional regulator